MHTHVYMHTSVAAYVTIKGKAARAHEFKRGGVVHRKDWRKKRRNDVIIF